MKTCLRAECLDGAPGKLLDLSFVDDDHEFGLSPDGTEIHIEGRGGFTVTRGAHYEKLPPEPPAVNGIPFDDAYVTEDGDVEWRLQIRRRAPEEAAALFRAGYREHGIPEELAEVMIEEMLKPVTS